MKPLDKLRSELVQLLSGGTWDHIEATHRKVQLKWRQDLKPGWGKEKYVERVLADLSEKEIKELADRTIATFGSNNCVDLQNANWLLEAGDSQSVSQVSRNAIADALDGYQMHPEKGPTDFLSNFASRRANERRDIEYEYGEKDQLIEVRSDFFLNAFRDPQMVGSDTTRSGCVHRALLADFGFFEWPDKRVFQFLERMVEPTVRQSNDQLAWVQRFNEILIKDGYELIEADSMSGHPVFRIERRRGGVSGRPRNLIFASNGPKPELGFSDAINNDIVVLKNEEFCLVYEQDVSGGLLWDDLVKWWAQKTGASPTEATTRKALGRRLLEAIDSQIEKRLFRHYFGYWRPRLQNRLPALLPQVYLHYDPLSVRQLHDRGEGKRFESQRMDFLLLLPERTRIVLELDGKQHYSESQNGKSIADASRYAETMRADRRLRLAGYEVYRFGGYELREGTVNAVLKEFFQSLFRHHRVITDQDSIASGA